MIQEMTKWVGGVATKGFGIFPHTNNIHLQAFLLIFRMKPIILATFLVLLAMVSPPSEACSFNIPYVPKGRAYDNIDFNDLPEIIKQCVYRKAGMDTQVLLKINVCSQKYGGAKCVGRISELKSCFAWFWKTFKEK